MKNIFLSSLLVVAVSNVALAQEEEDKVTSLRTLNCEGSVKGASGAAIPVKMTIEDYTVEYKLNPDDTEAMKDYGTHASITDPQNPQKVLKAVTNNDGSEDPQPLRDEKRDGAWAGLSFFDLYRDGADNNKNNRDGLLVLGSMKKPKKANKRQYEVGITIGELNDPKAVGFNGLINCDLN